MLVEGGDWKLLSLLLSGGLSLSVDLEGSFRAVGFAVVFVADATGKTLNRRSRSERFFVKCLPSGLDFVLDESPILTATGNALYRLLKFDLFSSRILFFTIGGASVGFVPVLPGLSNIVRNGCCVRFRRKRSQFEFSDDRRDPSSLSNIGNGDNRLGLAICDLEMGL